jgi:Dolichyl-phosphate-mannose-protein mannosyltransferase
MSECKRQGTVPDKTIWLPIAEGIKRPPFLIISLVPIGLLLRLPGLHLGLWRDEASTYFNALPTDLGEMIETVIYSELNPPGFYLIMHQWIQWFGVQEVLFKVPALFFGLLLIPASYALGRLAGSLRVGVIAATIATFAPEAIYYSQEARPYTLAALLCCLVVLLYCKALTSKYQAWYLLGFVLCADLLLYVQYTGLLLVGSLAIITLYLLWYQAINIRLMPFAIAFGIIFLLFTPWLQVFLTHLYTGTPWIDKQPWRMRPKLLFQNIAYTLPFQMGAYEKIYLLLFVLLGLGFKINKLYAYARQSFYKWNTIPKIYAFILGVSLILLAGILAALGYGYGGYMFPFTPIAWAFYGSCLIALFQYIDRQWTGQWNRFVRWTTMILLVSLLVLPSTNFAFSLGNINKSGIRSLVADMESKHQEKTLYILSPDYFGPTFGYYLTQRPVQFYGLAEQPVRFYGFARWDKPEIFSPRGYAEIWANPRSISDTEQRIQDEIQKGYRKLALIQASQTISDVGSMRFSLSDRFLSRLKQKYSLLEKIDYYGRSESVTLYLFALSSSD